MKLIMNVYNLLFFAGQFFMHWLCYGFHAILLTLHVVLVLLLINHPEHNIIMASDDSGVTVTIARFLSFFLLYSYASFLYLH